MVQTLKQPTNLVLLMSNTESDIRKFVVWRTDMENPKEVLSGLEITRIAVEDSAKLFEHPLETGETIVDHEIFEPKSAVAQVIISNDDADTLKELEYLYLTGTPLKIRAGNKIINNVVIGSKPIEITSEMFDKTRYTISFKEAQEVTPAYIKLPKAKSPASTSKINSGIKQAKEDKTKNQSWIASAVWGRKNRR